MQDKYNHTEVERAAQAAWIHADAYRVVEHAKDKSGSPKQKYYACSMLPYPSGKLHMGHVRRLRGIIARLYRCWLTGDPL